MCGTETASLKSKTTLSKIVNLSSENDSKENGVVLNLDHGDPTVYEEYWSGEEVEERCTVVIKGSEFMSYISDFRRTCWFMEAELEAAIRRLHGVAGNADVEGRHVVVGTGSTQLYHAVLYALTSPGGVDPVNVVTAAPYYSQYPDETDFLRSGLYKWGGDAHRYNKEGPYIEVVTSPNNPDGHIRKPVVNRKHGDEGKIVYDLAYYWPQYTPITRCADHDIMYFTFSKSTGHAGSRIGWAIVKDEEIARKMTKFIDICSIGVSKDSQHRAAKIMGAICDEFKDHDNFFKHAQKIMARRWKRLREAVALGNVLTLPNYPKEHCLFSGELTESHPAFAWLKVKDGIEDCEKFLKEHKIMARGGQRFGSDPSFARLSMLSREEAFDQFLERLASINGMN